MKESFVTIHFPSEKRYKKSIMFFFKLYYYIQYVFSLYPIVHSRDTEYMEDADLYWFTMDLCLIHHT